MMIGHQFRLVHLSLFQTSKSIVTKKLVAVVTNVKQDTLEVQYMSAISKQRFKICSNDKGIVSQKSVLQILPSPSLKQDIYHFNEEQNIIGQNIILFLLFFLSYLSRHDITL